MSSLLSLLSLGSNAISAQNTGVGVATNNAANVNTEGYSRQRVDLRAQPGTPLGGVRSLQPDRMESALLAARIRTSSGSFGLSRAFHAALMDLEGRMAGEGATIDRRLGELFGAFSRVSAAPTDPQLRESTVTAARDLAIAIRRRAASVDEARKEADQRVRDATVSATDLARQLAAANRDVARTGDPVASDRRELIAKQLAEIVGGAARVDRDGQMRFTLDGGAVLVDGAHAARLDAVPDPATGMARVEVVAGNARRDVTGEIAGGSIGGDIQFRDTTATRTAASLDQLAFDLATAFNATHRAHAGLDGVAGRDLFVQPTGAAGAAAALAVDPAVAADPTLLATATIGGGPGDAGGAVALASLRDALAAAGGTSTLGDAALDVIADVAYATRGAEHDASRDQLIGEHLAGLRDSLAGVDLDEELANLSRFEHASAAMTRFVATVDDMLTDLIARL
jgi:flagellar hook-associated protein 1 FlgK